MNIEAAPAILTTLLTFVTGLVGLLRSERTERNAAKEEADLLASLPEGSEARKVMTRLVTARVRRLEERKDWKRNWPMVAMCLVFSTILAYLVQWLVRQNTWWGWIFGPLAGFFLLVILYGLFDSIKLKPSRPAPTAGRSH